VTLSAPVKDCTKCPECKTALNEYNGFCTKCGLFYAVVNGVWNVMAVAWR